MNPDLQRARARERLYKEITSLILTSNLCQPVEKVRLAPGAQEPTGPPIFDDDEAVRTILRPVDPSSLPKDTRF